MPVPIKETPYLYFPVPKVASTSIKTAILDHYGGAPSVPFRNRKRGSHVSVHKIYRSPRFRLWRTKLIWPQREWICVVRDPISRFPSGYRNRILHYAELEVTAKRAVEARNLTTMPSVNAFAINIETYARASKAVRHHFAPQCTYLGVRPERFSHVFDLSELDRLQQLLRDTGADFHIPHEQTGGSDLVIEELSAEALASLKQFYAEDYRVWGRYFSPPLPGMKLAGRLCRRKQADSVDSLAELPARSPRRLDRSNPVCTHRTRNAVTRGKGNFVCEHPIASDPARPSMHLHVRHAAMRSGHSRNSRET
ncbi:sulfotransferase family 2 domain-containing protein [Oceanomicrobium pacificus]|uniref:Sulfotransferase family 2 domain-containing protein n=1 Tax=Oceanomicrobium pacificus TaxID=2692916 RepID=A0A6B0TYM8_9RHOB|nr:sulfotransferase family 2 domain-containing protein [Oceanomicrobium pacificus]MXU66134.1 sulfotransferase family 2 domain-containing protein [Oceanomicrobium pacificus]